MSPIAVGQSSTSELACVRVVAGRVTFVVVVQYQPGSVAVLNQVATLQNPIYVAGDLNVRLDRPDDPTPLGSVCSLIATVW